MVAGGAGDPDRRDLAGLTAPPRLLAVIWLWRNDPSPGRAAFIRFATMRHLRSLDTFSYLALLAFIGYLLAPIFA